MSPAESEGVAAPERVGVEVEGVYTLSEAEEVKSDIAPR